MSDLDVTRVGEHVLTTVEQAEQSVVGSVMLSKDALWEVLDGLKPGDFLQPRLEYVMSAAASLAHRNEPVDAITVGDELDRTGRTLQAGGLVFLHELTGQVATTANVGYYIDIVRAAAIRRRLTAAGIRLQAMGNATQGDVFELVENARAEVDQVSSSARVAVHPVGDTLDALIDSLNRKPEYMATPWPSLDNLIGGFTPGGLYIVGARPGEGKTIVGLQSAAQLAHRGVVAYCSLEMSEADLQMRLISQYGEIHMQSLRNHTLNDEQMRRLADARRRFQDAPIYIDDVSESMTQIRSFIRSVSRRGTLAGVVVDYLQLIEGGSQESRQAQVSEMSRQLKKLARSLGVPVIALSQLNREKEKRADGKPQLSDLRESGSLEQDADVVMLLNFDKPKSELEVIVAKNRHGEQGSLRLDWQGQFARLRDKTWASFGSTTLEGI